MDMEQILEEAKRKYPIGTRYVSASKGSTATHTVVKQDFTIYSNNIIWGENGKGYLYDNGVWAEVREYPAGFVLEDSISETSVIHYEIY